MKKNMFRGVLILALAAAVLLSGLLGVNAQAAKDRPILEIPRDIFGEEWFIDYDKEDNMSVAVFDPAEDETVEAYVNDLAEELKLKVEVEEDEDDVIYTLYKRSDVYVMVFDDQNTGMVYIVFMHDNVELIDGEAARQA